MNPTDEMAAKIEPTEHPLHTIEPEMAGSNAETTGAKEDLLEQSR
jgi:hypothetical protein